MRYEICHTHTPAPTWELYSVVKTKWGGDARNFICEGTREYCETVRDRLEKPSASMMLRPREKV